MLSDVLFAVRRELLTSCFATGGGNCTFDVSQQFSVIKLSLGILGLILYSFAAPLSESMLFRLGAGSMSFMLLSALILLFVLYRYLSLLSSS